MIELIDRQKWQAERKEDDGQGTLSSEKKKKERKKRIVEAPCDRGKSDAIEECLNNTPARPESGWLATGLGEERMGI